MIEKIKSTGNRYADDYSGNHIDRIRRNATGLGLFKDYKTRICTVCNSRKPVKGGTMKKGSFFTCCDCKGSV